MASQRQLEEMAARYDAARAEDLLAAAEKLAREFGETVVLEALLAALNNRLVGAGASRTSSPIAPSSHEETRPVYAHVDTTEVTSQRRESIGGTAYADVRGQAAPGRAGLRSLLGVRRSSTGLVDESQALANCKPLSTAVLSITPRDEEEQTPSLMPPSRPRNAPRETVRDAESAGSGDAAASSHSPSTWSGNPPASSSGAGGDGDA